MNPIGATCLIYFLIAIITLVFWKYHPSMQDDHRTLGNAIPWSLLWPCFWFLYWWYET